MGALDVLAAAAVLAFTDQTAAMAAPATAVLPLLWLACLAGTRAYPSPFVRLGRLDMSRRIIRAGCAFAVVSWALSTATAPAASPRPLLLVAATLTAVATALRVGDELRSARNVLTRRRIRIVVAGHVHDVVRALRELERPAAQMFDVVAVCVPRGARRAGFDVPVSAGFSNLAGASSALQADAVMVLPCRHLDAVALRRLGWQLEASGTHLYVGTPLLDVASARTTVTNAGALRLLHVRSTPRLGPRRLVKSCVDRTGALLVLLVVAPLMLGIALAIRWDSSGPALFRQARVGRAGRHFTMLKFRTMTTDAETLVPDLLGHNEADGVLFKLRRDPRITRLGRVLRRYSLDELPQFVNVLRGDMSLVGPRPALPSEVVLYEQDPMRRLAVKPGLTGLWQVSGRSDLSWEDTVRLDLMYVDNWSLALDAGILCRTVRAVVNHRGAY